ncbi:MAG: tRNA adenosine(34) deaminase TadA [Deltaproteobacteria bacterium]
MDDVYFMKIALEEARRAALAGEVPVGAVLVDADKRVLAQAGNAPIRLQDPTAHAEIIAIREAARTCGNYRLTGTSLYVTIEPCIMCAGAIVLARIRRLIYGAPDPKSGACGSLYDIVRDARLNHRVELTCGVLEEECREMIRSFFAARR